MYIHWFCILLCCNKRLFKNSVILCLSNLGRTATCKRSRKKYEYSKNSKFTKKKDKKLINEL